MVPCSVNTWAGVVAHVAGIVEGDSFDNNISM